MVGDAIISVQLVRQRPRFPVTLRSFLILIAGLIAAGCGGGPVTPQTLGPILVCPANLTVHSPDGNATAVVYEAPQVVAGEPPLRTKCSPESGSLFPLGNST